MAALETSFSLEPELLVATFLPSGERIALNHAWETVFGPQDDVWLRLPDPDKELVRDYTSDAASGSLVTNRLFMVQHPARDQAIPVLIHFLPVMLPASGDDVLAIMVTGEVLAEPTSWMLSQTERHRMETLGRMTMGMIHDFNNLLSGIVGHTELLKRVAEEDPASVAGSEHLQTIEKASLDGATLVRRIQQYIRQERQSAFEPVDLRKIVEDAVALTKPYWYNEPRRQGVVIDATLEPGDIPPILGSPSELRDVFVNLILNAVQAMPQGGKIAIQINSDEKSRVLVSVKDTGTGMTDRVRARIFEPLFTTKGKRGTGMGLAVCYGTVQEHDGDIEVETRLGYGTSFVVSFPAADIDTNAVEAVEDTVMATPAQILVVDDEEMVRNVLARLLRLRGHEVTTAESGPIGLEILQTRSFDLIFTDQGMPEMAGREFAGAVRSVLPDIPIALITGDTDVGEPDANIDIVISKPFRGDQLESAIRLLLRRQSPDG
jgi:signal transduction histidine kinase